LLLWATPAQAQATGSVDLSSVTFNSLPAYEKAGDIASVRDLAPDLGYDPKRHWEAGDFPSDVFTLGDFQSSLDTQSLNLDQISQLSGVELPNLKIADVPFLQGKTLSELVEAVPSLKAFTLEEIPALAEVIDFDLTATLGEIIDADELIGELDISQYLGDFSVLEIPNLDLASLDAFKDWQTMAIADIPGLGDIELGALSDALALTSGVTATHDVSYGPKEHTKTPTKFSITGSDQVGFTVQCAQERGCANIELEGAGQLHGAQWIAGGDGEGQQMVEGGTGLLSFANGGQEPTGRHPFGDIFKVVLTETSESKGTADFALYFNVCAKGAFYDLGCTPYFLGPVPMPVLNTKEKGMVVVGLLDDSGGATSGLQAPESWEKLRPAAPQEVTDLIGQYASSASRGGRSLCGEGPGGINFHALAEAIHGIESSGGGDPYTVPGGLYVDGGPYGYPNERGYALGRYQYMSYREDVAAIISAKSGGAAFLERTYSGQQPTRAEIAQYFSPEEQDALFVEDQSKTIQSLLDQDYSGDRILEILGQLHFGGGAIMTDGTLDSKSVSDGYGTYSLWDYGQITKEGYYKDLEASGEASKCAKATGDYQSPVAGYKPHEFFNPDGIGGRVHKGVDVGGNLGDPVFAADGGVVSVINHGNESWGLHIIIDHGNGQQTLYGHLSGTSVSNGDTVAKGDKIGAIGSTGESSGPHLHFEVIGTDGGRIDPDSVIDWNDY
jgi:murein DD-endopeptidase MepM/ murein hydrolase activator NlpD